MKVVGNLYQISFSSKNVKQFNKIFATLMRNMTSTGKIPSFKVDCTEERITINVAAGLEGFNFIADIVEKIDNFSIEYTSSVNELPTEINDSQEVQTEDVIEAQIDEPVPKIVKSADVEEKLEVREVSKEVKEAFKTQAENTIKEDEQVEVIPSEASDSEDENSENFLTLEEQHEAVLKNQGLIRFIANKMDLSKYEYDDIISVGNIGLIKASKTFDKTKEFRFATYAAMCIKNEMLMYFRKENKHKEVLSLNDILTIDKNGQEFIIEDVIEDKKSNFVETIENADAFEKVLNVIFNCFNKQKIVVILYKIAGLDQRAIASRVGLSQSYVSRLGIKIPKWIAEYLKEDDYDKIYLVRRFKEYTEISFRQSNELQYDEISRFIENNSIKGLDVSKTMTQIVLRFPSDTSFLAIIAKLFFEVKSVEPIEYSNPKREDYSNDIQMENEENASPKEDVIPQNESGNDVSRSKLLKDFILNKETTTLKEIREVFPEIPNSIIYTVIHVLKDSGLVISNGFGSYQIQKSELVVKQTKSNLSKEIKEYILSRESFRTVDVRGFFPKASSSLIGVILNEMLKKGNITRVNKGEYVVNKK